MIPLLASLCAPAIAGPPPRVEFSLPLVVDGMSLAAASAVPSPVVAVPADGVSIASAEQVLYDALEQEVTGSSITVSTAFGSPDVSMSSKSLPG